MCDNNAVRNILSLFSSSYSGVFFVVGGVHNPHDLYIFLWAGRHFSLKSILTGRSKTSLKPKGFVMFVD